MTTLFRVRVTLAGWTGGPGLATHYFVDDASPVGTPEERAQELVDRVRAAWVPIGAKCPAGWTATVQGTVDALNTADGVLIASYSATVPAAVTGTEGANFGPASSGICVNWLTADFVAGRRVRGRTFVSPMNDAQDPGGTPTALHLAAGLAMFPILSEHSTGEPRFVVWHRPVAGVGGSEHIVTGRSVKDQGSVLRSRR